MDDFCFAYDYDQEKKTASRLYRESILCLNGMIPGRENGGNHQKSDVFTLVRMLTTIRYQMLRRKY